MLFARLDINEIMKEVEKIREAQRAEYEKENGIQQADEQSAKEDPAKKVKMRSL